MVNQTKRTQRISAFLNSITKAHSPYEVEWIIDDLSVERTFKAGPVEVVPAEQTRIGAEEGKHDWLIHHEPQWRERAFAKVTISAGSPDKALKRAVNAIDDALHEVRHAMRDIRVVPEAQRRWHRGTLYLVTDLLTGTTPKGGWTRGWQSADLGLSGDMLTHIEGQLDHDSWLYDESIKKSIREPVLRAIHCVGSSQCRESNDDKALDLCTALECLLAFPGDPRKAEAIALRSILLSYETGDGTYFVHPYDLYSLYLVRNDIIHGSGRRVASDDDCKDLRLVVDEALEQIHAMMNGDQRPKSKSDLFQRLQEPEELHKALDWLDDQSWTDDQRHEVVLLAREWRHPKQKKCC